METQPRSTDWELRSAAAESVWRRCEYCDCKTNARERICCPRGRDADRRAWDRAALAPA